MLKISFLLIKSKNRLHNFLSTEDHLFISRSRESAERVLNIDEDNSAPASAALTVQQEKGKTIKQIKKTLIHQYVF